MEDINNIIEIGALFDGRYKLLRPLSSDGGTADVWLALDTNTIDEVYDDDADELSSADDTGIKVAIKIYRPKNALDLGEQRFREEFKIVFNCHHMNLVQPINFSIYEGIPYLVLPFCKNGSSESLQGKFSDKDELWRYIRDVSSGLAYLHAFNPIIVHHDIKPANILIDDNNNFAITDFGISSQKGLSRDEYGYDETLSGTMAYMAPECFNEDYESIPESDIWSFGATLYELVTGRVPFGEDGGVAQYETSVIQPISEPIPKDIKNLIYDCLSLDPSQRPSAQTISKAASEKQYPLKNKSLYLIGGGVAAVALIVLAVLLFIPDKKPEEVIVTPTVESNESVYERAMGLVDSTDAADLKSGLVILDSLANMSYIPALYQLGYTYGWYSDSASVARKKLLDIDIYPDNTALSFLPKAKKWNDKAINYFSRIKDLDGEAYPYMKADALYRLAVYYGDDTKSDSKVLISDRKLARRLFEEALVWAEKSNDPTLINRINKGLKKLK